MASSIALALHLLAAVIWVGGMFFAYMALRPVAASVLQAPERLQLWAGVFSKFFPWVWLAIISLLLTGYWMIFALYNGMAGAPSFVHMMNGLGIIMMLIFLHVFFAPYRRLKQAVAAQDWAMGAGKLAQIRLLVGINTIIGLTTIAIAGGGHYFS
jgi:uncharacterized membrane protein